MPLFPFKPIPTEDINPVLHELQQPGDGRSDSHILAFARQATTAFGGDVKRVRRSSVKPGESSSKLRRTTAPDAAKATERTPSSRPRNNPEWYGPTSIRPSSADAANARRNRRVMCQRGRAPLIDVVTQTQRHSPPFGTNSRLAQRCSCSSWDSPGIDLGDHRGIRIEKGLAFRMRSLEPLDLSARSRA
jgi:hypothetical protein